jgi:hypothetical protein
MFRSATVESLKIGAMNQASCHDGLGLMDFVMQHISFAAQCSKFEDTHSNTNIHTRKTKTDDADNLSDETQSGRADGLPLASSSPSLEPTLQSLYCNIHSLLSTSSLLSSSLSCR